MNPRVLIVDDLPEVRRQLGRALEGLGVEIVEAPDGLAALEVARRSSVGAVVTDVRMPRMDGLALLRALRDSNIPVILHSGYADVAAAVEGLRLGAVDFLAAPLDLARLRSRVTDCLERAGKGREEIAGRSPELVAIRAAVARMADATDPLLITGETGVGKEVVARALHAASRRHEAPFIAINMAALPEGLLESELFGHEKGAFTGASSRRFGRFEQAQGGTLLLDEIGDAPPRVQAQLLRLVETRRFERLGGSRSIGVDVRIVAATHRHLPMEVAQHRFREDLWYRLCGLRIHVAPLRERLADVEALALLELARLSGERGDTPFELSREGCRRLQAHSWPGNVRELRLVVRRMAVLAGRRRLLDEIDVAEALRLDDEERELEELEAVAGAQPAASRREFERHQRDELIELLNAHRWNVSSAARELGIGRGAFRSRLRSLGIDAGRNPGDD